MTAKELQKLSDKQAEILQDRAHVFNVAIEIAAIVAEGMRGIEGAGIIAERIRSLKTLSSDVAQSGKRDPAESIGEDAQSS